MHCISKKLTNNLEERNSKNIRDVNDWMRVGVVETSKRDSNQNPKAPQSFAWRRHQSRKSVIGVAVVKPRRSSTETSQLNRAPHMFGDSSIDANSEKKTFSDKPHSVNKSTTTDTLCTLLYQPCLLELTNHLPKIGVPSTLDGHLGLPRRKSQPVWRNDTELEETLRLTQLCLRERYVPLNIGVSNQLYWRTWCSETTKNSV